MAGGRRRTAGGGRQAAQAAYGRRQAAAGRQRGSAKGGLLVFLAVVVLLGLALHRPLMKWFGIGSGGGARAEKQDAAGADAARFSGGMRAALTDALAALDEIGVALTKDGLEFGHAAHRLEAALGSAAREGGETAELMRAGAGEAKRLGETRDVDDARKAFQDVSARVLPVVATDAELTSSWYLFECPMESGFNKWVQSHPTLENPYMGQGMLKCGSRVDWNTIAVESPGAISYYTCPMHPSVQSDRPGQCPICGMDLTPVTKGEVASGVIQIDNVRQQRIGVRVGEVERRRMTTVIRATGRTAYDETRVREVTLRLGGFVERLHVNETGSAVRRGQPMLELYSPELLAAQKEYLIALRSSDRAAASSAPHRADYLVRAAREKLRLWGIGDAEIDRIAATGEPMQRMPLLSPFSGFVIEKNVVEGASVMAGQTLYRIAALDRIWVEAEVYERDLGLIETGLEATISLPSLRGRTWEGQVSHIYPYLDPATRTGRIRIELANADLALRPEMFADVEIQVDRGWALVVPDGAVVQTGPRQLVFLDLGEGRFRPKEVKAGPRDGDWVEIVEGLNEGDRIVVSSNFLVAAESRIRASEKFWGGGEEGAGHERH